MIRRRKADTYAALNYTGVEDAMVTRLERAEILSYLHHHRDRLLGQYSLETIGVFGSVARSSYTEDSDVDLVVRFLPGTRRIHALKSALRSELEEAFGRPVQVASEKYIKPYYRSKILSETVYV
ncbi:MAG: hypothetical protein EA382_06185 [Spirochaetaceae bacterium]|nr:MAG: hypothetical protein EA382_06185 [Spirochaetaceae bacterium]